VTKAVLISSGYLSEESERAKTEIENDFVAQQVQKHPTKFIAACGVPVNVTWAQEELVRCNSELKMKFLKVHPFGNSNKMTFQKIEDRALFRNHFAKADALDMTVLVHSAFYDPFSDFFLSVLARGFPNTAFVFIHTHFNNFRSLDYLLDHYRRNPTAKRNVFLELSWTVDYFKDHIEKDVLVWYVRKWGIENVVFGSDTPDFGGMTGTLASLKQIGFSDSEIKTMLSMSSQKLLNY
jgi:predicted TIM-barrel fold metal-dependent hydrolase